jgi:hypothetical protein
MADEFVERLTEAFAEDGVLQGVGLLVLECTWLPEFRSTIRSVTSLPVLDIVHFAKSVLE